MSLTHFPAKELVALDSLLVSVLRLVTIQPLEKFAVQMEVSFYPISLQGRCMESC